VAAHVVDCRDDQDRISSRWWPLHWTSPLVEEAPRPISLFDIAELRGVVDTNRVAGGLSPIHWTGRTDDDPTFVAGLTPIRAVHFTQLRLAVADLWDVAGLGQLPEFRAGPIVPGTRVISVRDPLDLRGWVERYEQARPDLAARVAWRYDVAPWIWPATDHGVPDGPSVEIWDATGHGLFWDDGDVAKLTELRRIDTHWHRLEVVSGSGESDGDLHVEVRPNSRTPPLSPALSPTAGGKGDAVAMVIASIFGCRFLNWEPSLPELRPDWGVDRDPLGRIVRVRDAQDSVLFRFAYDGLGRLRKWVDTATWHVVGPDHVVQVIAQSSGLNATIGTQEAKEPV
jgi:YD repeat-containing protein